MSLDFGPNWAKIQSKTHTACMPTGDAHTAITTKRHNERVATASVPRQISTPQWLVHGLRVGNALTCYYQK